MLPTVWLFTYRPVQTAWAVRHARSRFAALLLAVALIGCGWWVWQHLVRAEGDCTVGITGTAAMVHVSGAHADATCNQMVDSSNVGKE
jgi:hypothetical protein